MDGFSVPALGGVKDWACSLRVLPHGASGVAFGCFVEIAQRVFHMVEERVSRQTAVWDMGHDCGEELGGEAVGYVGGIGVHEGGKLGKNTKNREGGCCAGWAGNPFGDHGFPRVKQGVELVFCHLEPVFSIGIKTVPQALSDHAFGIV